MDALQEAKDLVANPLPEVAIREPLGKVYECDNLIAKLESTLARIREERTTALNYAVKNQILDEGDFKVEEKYRKTRTLNIEKFKVVFPEVFMTCCDVERRDLEQKMEHLGEKINLTLIDKLIKPVALEAAPGVVLVKEVITYNVVKKL